MTSTFLMVVTSGEFIGVIGQDVLGAVYQGEEMIGKSVKLERSSNMKCIFLKIS